MLWLWTDYESSPVLSKPRILWAEAGSVFDPKPYHRGTSDTDSTGCIRPACIYQFPHKIVQWGDFRMYKALSRFGSAAEN